MSFHHRCCHEAYALELLGTDPAAGERISDTIAGDTEDIDVVMAAVRSVRQAAQAADDISG